MPESENPIPRLRPALIALRDWFVATETPYLVIGGLAVSLVARARATFDVDAVILTDEDALDAFLTSGYVHGFKSRIAAPIEFARQSRMLLLVHEPSGTAVDISLGGLRFEKESIARGVLMKVEDVELRVPTPEDLVIMKAVASRSVDLADIEMVVTKYPDLDRRRVRRWVRDFAATMEMPEIMERLDPFLSAKRRTRSSKSRTRRRRR